MGSFLSPVIEEKHMKRIIFTKHAEEMLAVRHVERDKVKLVLTQPGRSIKAREGKIAYLKNFGMNDLNWWLSRSIGLQNSV